jgi:VWFA-related protein
MTAKPLSPALALAFVLALPVPAPAADPPPSEKPAGRFSDSVSVGLASVRARFFDPEGAPIVGLESKDVRVKIGRKPVPVVAVDYYDGSVSAADAPDAKVALSPEAKRLHAAPQVSARGQIFVVWVDADGEQGEKALESSAPWRRLAAALKPNDLAAVVSFGDQLELQLDFTKDREALFQAIVRGRKGDPPATVQGGFGRQSLARLWDREGIAKARHTEEALQLAAAALSRLPGEKVVLFLGIGPSRLAPPTGKSQKLGSEIYGAVAALQQAGTTVFVLDQPHSASGITGRSLRLLAESTGGSYAPFAPDPEKAIDRLAPQLQGYYLVTFNLEKLDVGTSSDELAVELVDGKGTVLTQPLRVVNLR